MTIRTPTAAEWDHEAKRVFDLLDRYPEQDEKLEAAILRRANAITNPQKLYNFIRALEDQNIHRENEKVIAIFEARYGRLPGV